VKKVVMSLILVFSYLSASDYSKGFKLYTKAKHYLRSGDLDNANKLFKKSLFYFKKADQNGVIQADLKIASLYCNGWGVDKNKEIAKSYLKKTDVVANIHIFDKCLKKLKGE
jgi:TPR repeat protein